MEENNLIIPDAAVTMTASTPVVSTYVNAIGCDVLECVLWLAVSVVGATSVGLIEILAASDKTGTGAVVVPFQWLYKTIGAATIKLGTAIPTKIEQSVSNIPQEVASYSTLAADGDKQQQFVIPIRSRQLPVGKPWVAVRFTAGAAVARAGQVMFIRSGQNYGIQEGFTII